MRKKSCALLGAGGCGAIVVVVLLVIAFLFVKGKSVPAPTFSVLNEETQKVAPKPDENSVLGFKNGLKINLPFGACDQEMPIVVKELAVEGGETVPEKVYEVNFDLKKEAGIVEFAMPVEKTKLRRGEFLNAVYYNESSHKWEPIPCTFDADNGFLLAYAEHFSKYGYSRERIQDGVGLNRRIINVPFPGRTMSPVMMQRILNGCRSPKGTSPHQASWDANMKFFAISSNASALWENAFQLERLTELNKVLTEAGMALAVVQLSIDLYTGNYDQGIINFTKSFVSYVLGKGFNTTFMNLALVNIFCIDYALTEFMAAAIDGRYQIYDKAARLYYEDRRRKHGENAVWWYKRLKKVIVRSYDKDGDPRKAVDKLFEDYFNTFWGNSVLVSEYQERVLRSKSTPWTGTAGMTKKIRKNVFQNRMHELRTYLTPVFDKIEAELHTRQIWMAREQMVKSADEMNKYYKFEVSIDSELTRSIPDGDLKNLKVEFATKADQKYWTMKTDKNGEIKFKATLLSFLHAGTPTQATLYVPHGRELKTYVAKFNLAPVGEETKVVFEDSKILTFEFTPSKMGIRGYTKNGKNYTRYPPSKSYPIGWTISMRVAYPFEYNKDHKVTLAGKYSCRMSDQHGWSYELTFNPKDQTISGTGRYRRSGKDYESDMSFSINKLKPRKGKFW